METSNRASVQWSFPALALLASVAGAQSVRLNAPLAGPTSDVTAFVVGPSRARAYYVADQDAVGVFELYSVPFDQSAPPIKLSDPMVSGGDVSGTPKVNARGRVCYLADASIDGSFELFSVRGDGTQPPKRLSAPMPAGRTVLGFQLTPDGERAVYQADQNANDVFDYFVVPVDGSASPLHLPAPSGGASPYGLALDPTSTRGVYHRSAYAFGHLISLMYRVELDAAHPPVQIVNDAVASIAGGFHHSLTMPPDGSWVSWVRDQSAASHPDTLFRVRMNASSPSSDALAGDVDEWPSAGQFTDDSAFIVFSIKEFLGGSAVLHACDANGTVSDLDTLGDTDMVFRIGPDGRTVFYAGAGVVARRPADRSAPRTFLFSTSALRSAQALAVSPDGERVVVRRRDALTGDPELLAVPSAGGSGVSLAPVPPGRRIGPYDFTPSSRFVVYDADMGASTHELFAVPSDGSAAARRVNGPLPAGGTISTAPQFVIAGKRVVYLASEITSGTFELFAAPIPFDDGRSAPSADPLVPASR